MLTINPDVFRASVKRDIADWDKNYGIGPEELVILVLPDLLMTLEVENVIFVEKDDGGEPTKRSICGVRAIDCDDMDGKQWKIMRIQDL